MNARVRWGLLGTARIAEVVLEAMRRSENAEVVAVASRDGERASTFASAHGIETSYGSYAELLEADDVDGVYIPLPNALHAPWSEKALSAGKHVLCEKPLGRHPDQVAAAFGAADRGQRLLAEAFMYRYHPQTLLVRKLVEEGAIGSLAYIKGTLSFTMVGKDVRSSAALDGGSLMDLGCYCVSAARLFAGEPERVYAEQVTSGREVDVQFAASMRMPGGVLAQFDCGFYLPRRDRLEIVGSEGWITLSDPWLCRSPTIELHRLGESEQLPVDPEGVHRLVFDEIDVYRREIDAVSAAILGQLRLPFGKDDAVGQARALDALLQSAGRGVPVRVDHDPSRVAA